MSSPTQTDRSSDVEILVAEFLQRDLVSSEIARQAKQLCQQGAENEALERILAERHNRPPRQIVD